MDHEEQTAEVVEHVAARLMPPLGPRRRRDESHDGGLSVDFTYDDRSEGPPAALEITTLRNERLTGSFAAMEKLEQRLDGMVRRERLGGWIAQVDGEARLRDVEAVLLGLMRNGTAIRPGDYTSDDIMSADDPHGLIASHERLRAQGIVALDRWQTPGFRMALGSHGRGIEGFRDLLEGEVAANQDKLERCRPRQTHLAVDVIRFDASTMPGRTDPPGLPDSVDHLWVLFGWQGAVAVRQVWHVERGSSSWDLVPDPRFAS